MSGPIHAASRQFSRRESGTILGTGALQSRLASRPFAGGGERSAWVGHDFGSLSIERSTSAVRESSPADVAGARKPATSATPLQRIEHPYQKRKKLTPANMAQRERLLARRDRRLREESERRDRRLRQMQARAGRLGHQEIVERVQRQGGLTLQDIKEMTPLGHRNEYDPTFGGRPAADRITSGYKMTGVRSRSFGHEYDLHVHGPDPVAARTHADYRPRHTSSVTARDTSTGKSMGKLHAPYKTVAAVTGTETDHPAGFAKPGRSNAAIEAQHLTVPGVLPTQDPYPKPGKEWP